MGTQPAKNDTTKWKFTISTVQWEPNFGEKQSYITEWEANCTEWELFINKWKHTDMRGTTQPILQFQVENIHDVYRELQHKEVQVSEMIFKKEGDYSVTFRDPDGHMSSLWGGWPSAEE